MTSNIDDVIRTCHYRDVSVVGEKTGVHRVVVTLSIAATLRVTAFMFCVQLAWIIGPLVKDDRQRFLQQVSKKQFRTVYHNANTCG